jgi:hypothetical protein
MPVTLLEIGENNLAPRLCSSPLFPVPIGVAECSVLGMIQQKISDFDAWVAAKRKNSMLGSMGFE